MHNTINVEPTYMKPHALDTICDTGDQGLQLRNPKIL